jgi:transitional endoplasmic reticulum ATPase
LALDFDLRNFKRLKDRGLRAHREGRHAEARFSLLKASECLFRIAGKSEEPFRTERSRAARELLDLARSLRPGAPSAEAEGDGDEQVADWRLTERPDVTFASVAGLDEVKEEIRLRMVYPFTHPEAAERYGIRGGGGLLLYGPPGTGKTLLARAVAGEIDAAFFTVRPSDIMSKWVGEAEKNVAKLFAEARGRERSVIFIDEVEALAPARTGDASSVMTRVVPQFLAELEGVSGRGEGALLFVGATNAPWDMDPAILRPGRFDVKVYVGLPDPAAREEILELNLADKPLEDDVDAARLAAVLDGYSGADLRRICEKALADSFLAEVKGGAPGDVGMEDLLAAARDVSPSVSEEDLRRYEDWAKR